MQLQSLLFDLNYKFQLIGASLLALAKSIYYFHHRSVVVWTSENDSNTLRVDMYFSKTEKKLPLDEV